MKQDEQIVKNYQSELKKDVQFLRNYLYSVASKKNNENQKDEDYRNSHCPYCSDTKYIIKYRNVTGEVEGKISGSFGMFGGGIHGYIDGETRTSAVFCCEKCKNEWLPVNHDYYTYNDAFDDLMYDIEMTKCYNDKIENYNEDDFDPIENEDFNTPEEELSYFKKKKQYYIQKCSQYLTFKAEAIRWYWENEFSGKYSHKWKDVCDEWLEEIGFTHSDAYVVYKKHIDKVTNFNYIMEIIVGLIFVVLVLGGLVWLGINKSKI